MAYIVILISLSKQFDIHLKSCAILTHVHINLFWVVILGLVATHKQITRPRYLLWDYEIITAKETNNSSYISRKTSRMFALVEKQGSLGIKVRI